MTTDKAVIEDSGDDVAEYVAKEASSIGYISIGNYNEQSLKAISVNKTAPSSENIENGKYPLCRSFYIAYKGQLTDLERDFITYVKGKGQEIVGESFVPASKSSTFLSNNEAGTISIHGSTSAAPLMERLAEEYMKINKNAVIIVEESDSTKGINDALDGTCDLAVSSRELKSYEKELLDYEIIARDAILIVVNNDNPLENISLDALCGIYKGDVSQWKDINN